MPTKVHCHRKMWVIVGVAVVGLLLLLPLRWSPRKPKMRLLDYLRYETRKVARTLGWARPLDAACAATALRAFARVVPATEFWLSEGTALGAVRGGDFISLDEDVDVALPCSARQRFNGEWLPQLMCDGFRVCNVFAAGMVSLCHPCGEKIDVDFECADEPCVACRTAAARATCSTCAGVVATLDLRWVTLRGLRVRAPGDAYLAYLYGPDWRTPRNTK